MGSQLTHLCVPADVTDIAPPWGFCRPPTLETRSPYSPSSSSPSPCTTTFFTHSSLFLWWISTIQFFKVQCQFNVDQKDTYNTLNVCPEVQDREDEQEKKWTRFGRMECGGLQHCWSNRLAWAAGGALCYEGGAAGEVHTGLIVPYSFCVSMLWSTDWDLKANWR